jgi:GNAT superfamily N-acetyltransferase
MFCFMIDPTGWAEIDGEAFAPGFFVWNSEVGRRTLGIQTFWFQAVCRNHIVWDAIEVIDFKRKHTASVHDGLNEIRRIIERLVAQRDARRDGFARVLAKAMKERLGKDAEEVAKALAANGIPRHLVKEALKAASATGRFTIFALVDVLTRLTPKVKYIGERTELDQAVAALFALAA